MRGSGNCASQRCMPALVCRDPRTAPATASRRMCRFVPPCPAYPLGLAVQRRRQRGLSDTDRSRCVGSRAGSAQSLPSGLGPDRPSPAAVAGPAVGGVTARPGTARPGTARPAAASATAGPAAAGPPAENVAAGRGPRVGLGAVGWIGRGGQGEQGSGVGQARRAVVDAVGGFDGVLAVAGINDLPAVIMDLGVTAPTQRHEVVQVGAATPCEGVHVVRVDLVLVGLAAAGAAAIERHQRLELRLGNPAKAWRIEDRGRWQRESPPAHRGFPLADAGRRAPAGQCTKSPPVRPRSSTPTGDCPQDVVVRPPSPQDQPRCRSGEV